MKRLFLVMIILAVLILPASADYTLPVQALTNPRADGVTNYLGGYPSAPTYAGLGIGGVARDGAFSGSAITAGYGRPIQDATVHLVNTSNGESYTKTTNNAGYYLCDEGASCFLTTKRPYDVWGEKLGFDNSPNYTAVAA